MIRVRQHISDGFSRERLKLESRRARGPVVVYMAMILIALGALGIIFRNINVQYPWENPLRVRVAVDHATGVKPGLNPVRLSGLQVGKIVDSGVEDGRAVLTLSIDEEYAPLYRDAKLRLRPQTALEDMYVNVEDRGTPAAGKLDEDTVLEAARTTTPVTTSDVLDTFNADTRARMGSMIDGFGAGLAARGDDLREAVVAIAPFLGAADRFSSEIARRGRATRRLVRNLRLLAEEVGRRDTTLAQLVEKGSRTVSAVSADAASLDRLLVELPPTLERVVSSFATLRGGLDDVDPALRALRPTAAALKPGLDALDGIADAANPALATLRRPVSRLQPLARSLGPTSASLDKALSQLRPAAPRLDRITEKVQGCELGLQAFFQWNPSIFKFGDDSGTFPRGDVSQGTETVGGVIHTPNLKQHPTCVDPKGGTP